MRSWVLIARIVIPLMACSAPFFAENFVISDTVHASIFCRYHFELRDKILRKILQGYCALTNFRNDNIITITQS